ncbi:MAG TPA: hypothetical protein VK611_26695 [Acidimicrobiales bacterium]|nr:hypothetical protein [Acidimicrobiales bacterium]
MIGSANGHDQHVWVVCGKPPPSRYVLNGGEVTLDDAGELTGPYLGNAE